MLSLLLLSTSKVGVDVSSAVDEATWKCLQSPGGQGPVEFAVVRVYRSTGTIDPSGAETIKAARAAGMAPGADAPPAAEPPLRWGDVQPEGSIGRPDPISKLALSPRRHFRDISHCESAARRI